MSKKKNLKYLRIGQFVVWTVMMIGIGIAICTILDNRGVSGQVNVIPGERERRIFYSSEYNFDNCAGTSEIESTVSQTRSTSVKYNISLTGGFEFNTAALNGSIELAAGYEEGDTFTQTHQNIIPVPMGQRARYIITWYETLLSGTIVNENGDEIGEFQATDGMVSDGINNAIPCSNAAPKVAHSIEAIPSDRHQLVSGVVSLIFTNSLHHNSDTMMIYAQPIPTDTPYDSISVPHDILEAAFSFEGTNDEWDPYIQIFDGVEMVLVPVGCFQLGSTRQQMRSISELGLGDPDTFLDESNGGVVCIDEPFWIDKYEVTNDQFARFEGVAGRESFQLDPELPRENITWYEAMDFCELRGGFLPTEVQWEFAARGPDALIFPWGDEFDDTVVAYTGNESRTVVGDAYPEGASWVGALNMSGNMWEWTASIYGLFPRPEDRGDSGFRSVRGGSIFVEDSVHAANRAGAAPERWSSLRGFRCARSID